MKRTFCSQRREMLLFLITYTAAVTSRVNLHGTIPSADCLRNTALQCSNNVATSRNHVATMLLRCSVALKIVVAIVTSPSACMLGFPNSDHVIYSPGILPFVFFTRTCEWDGIWKKPFSRFLWWGWGGGHITKRCIMGNVKMVNLKISGSWREETASEFR